MHKKCSLNIVFLDFLLSLRCNVKCIKQVVMNSEIILEINGYKCNLLKYKYCFSRNIDCEGRPVTGVLGGNIYIEMESNGSNCILDMMLVDTDRQRPAFFSHAEHFPVWGKILHSIDDMMFRELAFDEAYLYYHEESMSAEGKAPMITRFLISPTRLDINRTIRLDRRINTTDGFWWEEYKEENIIYSPTQSAITLKTEVAEIEIVTPLLINKYTNKKGLEYSQSYKLRVKSYTNGVPESKHEIKWEYSYISNNGDVVIGTFEKEHNRGELIDFKVSNEDLIGTIITFYAYIADKNMGGKCSVYVNPLYYYKGRKEWGKLQSERKDENSQFSAHGHKLSLQDLLKNKNADFWAKSRMRDLDKLTEKAVLDHYKCINNLVLSDNDNIEQVVTNNFITGKQTTLSFDEHSILSKKLHSVPSFQPYFQMYLNVIKGLIVKNKLEVVNGEQIKKEFIIRGNQTGTPNFSVKSEIYSYDYYGIFGGTQKIVVDIEVIQFSQHKFLLKTKMHIKDWYGSDWEDINGIAIKPLFLQCFFWLQHHYNYHPFETEVVFVSNDIIEIK